MSLSLSAPLSGKLPTLTFGRVFVNHSIIGLWIIVNNESNDVVIPIAECITPMVGVGRNGTPGAGTSSGNVYDRNPFNNSAESLLGTASQNSTQPSQQAFVNPTCPVQEIEVVTADNFKVWRVRMRMGAAKERRSFAVLSQQLRDPGALQHAGPHLHNYLEP